MLQIRAGFKRGPPDRLLGSVKMTRLFFLLIFFSAFFQAGPAWAANGLAKISTVAGQLCIIDVEKGKIIRLKDETIHKGTCFMGVHRFFRLKKYDAILLRDFTGPIACPVQFMVLTLRRGGGYQFSRPFGHCSDKPDITLNLQTITIEFRPFGSMPGATWAFDGQSLQKVK